MKLHFGPVPEDFTPDESWRSIREPGPILLQFIALPVGLATMFGAVGLWNTALDSSALNLQGQDQDFATIAFILLSFPLLIVVHELLHAVVHPRFGNSPSSILGIWPAKLLFYAHYEGPLSRNRFLAVFAAPFLVLTILPILLALFGLIPSGLPGFLAAWFSCWNGLFACGDIVGFALILSQIPGRAEVRNRGWRTYWRPIP